MRNGTKIRIVDNLKEVYDSRGWQYIPKAHDKILGKEAIITNIEPKYSQDYIMSVEFEDKEITYSGTLPIEGVEVLELNEKS